jgi:hypothetical protein
MAASTARLLSPVVCGQNEPWKCPVCARALEGAVQVRVPSLGEFDHAQQRVAGDAPEAACT